jgi:zinc transport system permease protein
MMADLFDAWQLFAESWISTWLLAPLLAVVGVAVVARGAVFQGVATAQASTAAVAAMLVLAQAVPWCGTPWAVAAASLVVAVGASVSATTGRSGEAANGWLFLAAGAMTPLLLVHSPHGLAEVQQLITSSLIGATMTEVWLFGGLLIGVVLALLRIGPRVRLVLLDRELAADLGMNVICWQAIIGVVVGVVVGLGLRVAGLLFVAGCLLLPALAAVQVCRTTSAVIWWAPLLATLAALFGTVIAHLLDLPPGQVVVAILALVCVVGWFCGRWRTP